MKMILSRSYPIRTEFSLMVIATILVVTIVASLWKRKRVDPARAA
jgi:hypothetical protein